jgi:hypothetical protein
VSWLEQAACRGKPTGWWFPARGDAFTTAVAKSICARCPVRCACLAAALGEEVEGGVSVGIRGGVSAQSRAVMLRSGSRPVLV